MKHKSDLNNYAERLSENYGFEKTSVYFRHRLLVDLIERFSPEHIVEVGCGPELLIEKFSLQNTSWKSWTIYEPAEPFAKAAIQKMNANPKVKVIEDFFEKSKTISSGKTLFLISGVLHEIDNPSSILQKVRSQIQPEDILHINVPNKLSLHRRLGQKMEIIKNTDELSQRAKRLEQKKTYAMTDLIQIAENFNFTILDQGGFLVKPFHHQLMHQIQSFLPKELLEGLNKLGEESPDLASEIFINLCV